MPITPTQAASAIAALMRQVLGTRDPSRAAVQQNLAATAKKRGATTSSGAGHRRDAAALIEARIAALDPNAPQFRHRALRMLVEVALLEEFGHGLINAPRFQGLIDLVARELESSEALGADIDTVLLSIKANLPGQT